MKLDTHEVQKKPQIISGKMTRFLLYVNLLIALIYFSWWFGFDHIDNPWLYSLLFIGEIYHVVMVLMFWFTIRRLGRTDIAATASKQYYKPEIDVFVTVAGEPVDIVRTTISAIKNTFYENMHVYILNDSFAAGKPNWREYESLAKELQVGCITRTDSTGAKAGNINHALQMTGSEFVAIFDADMQPFPDFFIKSVPFLTDSKVGFVQSPQYYANHSKNTVTAAAWEQQGFFFGPIMRGKNTSNAAFICGTNVIVRRKTLQESGGINEKSIAEDFLTSLYIHQKGWKSVYIPEILAQGLAPEDLLSYYKQQLRWARGSVEILFRHNPIFKNGLTINQRIEYLASTLYYCNGIIVLIDSVVPIMFLLFNLSPIHTATSTFAIFFLPFITSIIYSLHLISQGELTFRAISFTQSSWYLQIQAVLSSILGKKMEFSVTPKKAQTGNFLFLAYPHLAYVFIALFSIVYAVYRDGLTPAVITNTSWVLFNVVLFIPYIIASYSWLHTFKNIESTKNIINVTN
ncbi:MAG: glycosyltransferase [Patescibacteria group bacterium]